jgi:hypothetical protein
MRMTLILTVSLVKMGRSYLPLQILGMVRKRTKLHRLTY